jgi:hypothetical protein
LETPYFLFEERLRKRMCRECLFVEMDSDGIDVDGCLKEEILDEILGLHPNSEELKHAYDTFLKDSENHDVENQEGCCEPTPPNPCLIVPPRVNATNYWNARAEAIRRFTNDMMRLADPKRLYEPCQFLTMTAQGISLCSYYGWDNVSSHFCLSNECPKIRTEIESGGDKE